MYCSTLGGPVCLVKSCFTVSAPSVRMSGMMYSLHISIISRIVHHMDIKSITNLVLTSKQFLPHLRDIKIKKRFHCLKIALIRLRFIERYIWNERKILHRFVYKPSTHFYDIGDSLLVMTAAMHIFSHFEYCGPPDYLMNFAEDQYNVLANMMLNFDDKSNYLTYVSNVYGLVANTPVEILREFMFKFDNLTGF